VREPLSPDKVTFFMEAILKVLANAAELTSRLSKCRARDASLLDSIKAVTDTVHVATLAW
jgi:hypothetical protein